MSDSASVKVAVRIRPFNSREKGMNATCCMKMKGVQSIIYHPETKKDKTFSFDYSYWSHDNFKEMPDGELVGTNKQYATQRMVYDDLGAGVLKNAYEGFNSTLFAYGQTGAGKSYSMVGYSVNKGIIPIVCKEMFMKVEKAADDPTLDYQVTVTMLEIYNERVRDLLNPKINPPGGLKIRSKPGVGVYVEDLTPVAVATYDEVSTRMDEGTANRTVASTKMNATSSRAHTVFGIAFSTITHDLENDVDAEMAARMNLVDLAGSERAESTGATGDRLKEGSAINASLSALGNVISALADMSMGKKKVFVPYRNSALTRLLQDALGGNSKTVMIAALSPADVNYDETLGTLRYADRAKKIKNKVVKMENPTDKIIRMLKEENARLMKMLSGQGIDVGAQLAAAGAAGGGGGTSDPAEIEALKQKLMAENEAKLAAQMEENEKMIAEMKKSWSEKLADSRGIVTNQMGETGATSMRSADKNIPYIVNLHEDTMLTEKVVYSFKEGITRIGRKTASEKQDVILSGLSISREHAIVENEEDGKKISLTPIEESKTYINGQLIKEKTELHQDDRVLFGNNYVFRFEHPEEESKDDYEKPPMDEAWNMAMNEYREANGLNNQSADDSIKALQKEEAKKREDLEMKLRDMELKMKEQKANAKKDLEAAMAKGGMSASEMASYQDAYDAKNQDLEKEMVKKRAMAEGMMKEQLKRKRETRLLEEKLAKLVPLVQEANLMADEMKKGVKFEARLQVKSNAKSALEELSNMQAIEPNVVMTDNNGSEWNWSVVKFDSRLYMMREMYQEFSDFGPRDIPKAKDPFWDPPEPHEIGKAFVYLKALAHLVEIENQFTIVDFEGKPQGSLKLDIYPEGPDGEDLDYLQSPDEIVGKKVSFRVKIPGATGLPSKYSNDVFVRFKFFDDTNQYETEAHDSKSTDPKFTFETKVEFEEITEEVKNFFLNDAAVFEVLGFNDQASSELNLGDDSGPAVCEQCEETGAEFLCLDCQTKFCSGCFNLMHKSAKKRGHHKESLVVEVVIDDSEVCYQCEENKAAVYCQECDKQLCSACEGLLHRSAKKKGHTRTPVGAGTPPPDAGTPLADGKVMCEWCEEKTADVKCVDCDQLMCNDCNKLMHKSKKKAGHVRESL